MEDTLCSRNKCLTKRVLANAQLTIDNVQIVILKQNFTAHKEKALRKIHVHH